MNFDLRSFFEQLLKAPARTKAVLALSLAAVVAVFALGGYISGQPHFSTLYTGLGDQERVAVEKALAGAQVRYRVSAPPFPYAIYVDESQYDQAQIAVALAEALRQTPKGIDSGAGGASTIFMSAGERAQTMQKREWQEAERLLEHLEFVSDATVTTSMPDNSPLRAKKPVMVSVALDLRGATTLTSEQARNVARLVMYRFGAPPENVMITDGAGRTLFDPTLLEDGHRNVKDLLESSSDYDSALAKKALEQIVAAYGPRKAVVSVTSQWNYDQSTTIDEKVDPEPVAVSTDVRTTQSPNGTSAAGGAAGLTNSSPGFGNENAGVGAASGSGALSSTKDEKKVFETSRQRIHTVHSAPRLERLFVSLVLDESLSSKREEVQKIVEAAVGYDKSRQDVIGVSTTAFAVEAVAEQTDAVEGEAAPTDAGPNRMLEMLLQRGVEIVSALGFLLLLFSSLKSSKKTASANVGGGGGGGGGSVSSSSTSGSRGGGGGGDSDVGVDPEALARAQIEELVRSDPRRVGEILSRWIDEKSTAKV